MAQGNQRQLQHSESELLEMFGVLGFVPLKEAVLGGERIAQQLATVNNCTSSVTNALALKDLC